jgi:hypothetical protein
MKKITLAPISPEHHGLTLVPDIQETLTFYDIFKKMIAVFKMWRDVYGRH